MAIVPRRAVEPDRAGQRKSGTPRVPPLVTRAVVTASFFVGYALRAYQGIAKRRRPKLKTHYGTHGVRTLRAIHAAQSFFGFATFSGAGESSISFTAFSIRISPVRSPSDVCEMYS